MINKATIHKAGKNNKTLCGRNLKEVSATTKYDWVTCKACKRVIRGAWGRVKF